MYSLSITYTFKYQLKYAPQYKWSTDKRCFNTKTGREIKKVYNNGSIGYNINGKFRTLNYLRPHLELIEKSLCPF